MSLKEKLQGLNEHLGCKRSKRLVKGEGKLTEASEKNRAKLLDAIYHGRVEFSEMGKRTLKLDHLDPDRFDIKEVQVKFWGPTDSNQGGIEIIYGTKAAGFGSCTICQKDGTLTIDNEGMSKEFVLSLFTFLLDKIM